MDRHLSLLERKKKQWEEERAMMNSNCGFWGRVQQDVPRKPALPTDKPPDPVGHRVSAVTLPIGSGTKDPNQSFMQGQAQLQSPGTADSGLASSVSSAGASLNSSASSTAAQTPTGQPQSAQSLPSQPPTAHTLGSPTTAAMMVNPAMSASQPQYIPVQLPMGMPGYSGSPVYVVMQPPSSATASQHLPPVGVMDPRMLTDFLRSQPQSPPEYAEAHPAWRQKGVHIQEIQDDAYPVGRHRTHEQQYQHQQHQHLQPHHHHHHHHQQQQGYRSLGPTSGHSSHWPDSPEIPPYHSSNSTPRSRGMSEGRWLEDRNNRARWGDRGVAVGHLWEPSGRDEALPRRGDSADALPPSWAERTDEDQVLPGAPFSKPGQRTYARGQGMIKLDPEEIAEKQKRKKQAEETQRIIQQQLEEKRRKKLEEEEREKREAAMWEERVRQQQEKEAKEYEEEQRKKREKEEAEQRRQEQMTSAIREAHIRAKKERDIAKFGRTFNNNTAGDDQQGDCSNDSNNNSTTSLHQASASATPPGTHTPNGDNNNNNEAQTPLTNTQSQPPSNTASAGARGGSPSGVGGVGGGSGEGGGGERTGNTKTPSINITTTPSAPASSSSLLEKLRLLQELGISPEYLIATGLLDKARLLGLLGTGVLDAAADRSALSRDSSSSLSAHSYVTDRLLTPTKFRGPPSRECGIQCDTVDELSDGKRSLLRDPRRRSNRREKAGSSGSRDGKRRGHTCRTPLETPDTPCSSGRPPWGHHVSDRPYRKQSEKDPYSGRRLRRRNARSLSHSVERDTPTEESDSSTLPRRRRKTWDKSRQESLSSDRSRSPSPYGSRLRGMSTTPTQRFTPHIKPSLTPSLASSLNSTRTVESKSQEKPRTPPQTKEINEDDEKEDEDDDDDVQVSSSPPAAEPFRSDSPPVPTLRRKLDGEANTFNIPEYPTGETSLPPAPTSPLLPALQRRHSLQEECTTPTLPKIPITPSSRASSRPPSRPTSRPSSPTRPASVGIASLAGRPGSRRASLTGNPRQDHGAVKRSQSASLPTRDDSRPATPRRLPPVTPDAFTKTKVEGGNSRPSTPSAAGSRTSTPTLRSDSPPVPAVAKRLSAETRDAHRPLEETRVSSRPESATSGGEEDVRTASVTSSGYESTGRRSSGEPRSLSEPLVSPDKWVILKSLSSLRQNLWKRQQDISQLRDSDESI